MKKKEDDDLVGHGSSDKYSGKDSFGDSSFSSEGEKDENFEENKQLDVRDHRRNKD